MADSPIFLARPESAAADRGERNGTMKDSKGASKASAISCPRTESRAASRSIGTGGFSLIELLIVVAIILIISAIAIPNFVRSRIAANEVAGVAACKKIVTANVVYSTTFNIGYAELLENLGPAAPGVPGNPNRAGLLDEILTSGVKHGYSFTYTSFDTNGDGNYDAFEVSARPVTFGTTGSRNFFVNQAGSVRYTIEDRPAVATDPPIN